MYYIVNQTDHIIAADNDLLDALSVSSLNDLQKEIALGNIELSSPYRREIHITIDGKRKIYSSESHTLSSLLGDMTLVEIKEEENNEEKIDTDIEEYSDFISLKDEMETEEESSVETDTPEEGTFETPIELFDTTEDNFPLELISDDIAEIDDTEEDILHETAPVFIDIHAISQKIGISTEDYDHFLKEYIDTALTLEDDLKSNKENLKSQAIDTLSHLSHVLHLSDITPIIEEIKNADDSTRNQHIKSFYHTLSKVVTTEEVDITEIENIEGTETLDSLSKDSFGSIDLSSVKPIHFDFQLGSAAEDLGLPIELIEEFVIDFIDQSHIETDKMLLAYQNGELETIQKIGHLLKGTSSNLRIKTLSDTLYAIQFCEDSTQLEDLIKTYWGHFLSFENQINITLKRI